jgi:hypothetical protein
VIPVNPFCGLEDEPRILPATVEDKKMISYRTILSAVLALTAFAIACGTEIESVPQPTSTPATIAPPTATVIPATPIPIPTPQTPIVTEPQSEAPVYELAAT